MTQFDPAQATFRGKAGLMRPAMALAMLGLLAACGGQPGSSGLTASRGHHHQTRSYDPPGPPSDPWGPYIVEAARRFDVPERWIREVMRQESGGRISATSPVGAMGLMQLMPGTFAELRSRYGLGDDPYHPYDNLMAGTAYLREMYDLYGTPAFLAAYNAGPRRLEDYLFNSRGLPTETRNYVARIGPRIDGHHPSRRVDPAIAMAAEIPTSIPPGPRRMDRSMIAQLREQRLAAQPGIQVASAPTGLVVRMDPIPDGSTPEGAERMAAARGELPAPTQFASAGSLDGMTVRMQPIPDRPAPARPEARMEPLPLPPVQHAVLTAPAQPAAPAPSAVRPQSFLGIGRAQASTLPRAPTPVALGGGWSVQVGAFSSEHQARNAAQQSAGGTGGRAVVQPVQQGRTTLYRARVTGLSQGAAQSTCERLRSRGGCSVIAPGA